MKKILNPTGGRPLKNEDAELFEQFITMLEAVFDEIPSLTDFIVSGCVISGSDISAGFIYYDSKICTFAGATGISFPLAMERVTVEDTPRTFFDSVSKNSLTTEMIVAQIGGGFSFDSSTPRWEDFFTTAANTTETRAGTDVFKAVTPQTLLDAFRNSSNHAASETNRGTAAIADQATARAGSNNTEIMTALRVLDALRNGANYQAQTSYPGVVTEATQAQVYAGTSGNVVTDITLAGKDGGIRRTVIQIGDWNMDSTASVNVAHGVTFGNIRNVSVIIKNDANSLLRPLDYDLGSGAAGHHSISSTNVILTRHLSGEFDNTDYDSTSYNRGWIIVDYTF